VLVLETERLSLRRLSEDDAEFILELLNEPAFIRYIGDRGVRSREDACRYIRTGPLDSYARFGYGLYRVDLRDGLVPIGICGLLKRDTLDHPDLGFAFLQRHWARGYGFESARAVLQHARGTLGLGRVLAITSPDNTASITLLEKLGFRFERLATLSAGAPEIKLFASDPDR
jgi:RimJ/RimL family protein N-acetyltransferase